MTPNDMKKCEKRRSGVTIDDFEILFNGMWIDIVVNVLFALILIVGFLAIHFGIQFILHKVFG